MIKTVKIPFKVNKNVIDKLFELNKISAGVWNECLKVSRDFSMANGGKWINKSEIQKQTKHIKSMHSQSVQAVCHKYLFSRDAAHKARKQGLNNRYPHKKKKFFNTKWTGKSFSIDKNGIIKLSLGNGDGSSKRPTPLSIKLPKNRIDFLFDSSGNSLVKEVELVFDKKLMFCFSYDDETTPAILSGGISCGIDPGEIHTISAVAENGENIIITGRKMRSIHRLRNKKLAEIQRLLSKCTKGSKQYKKYMKAKRFVLSKSENQLKDVLHKTTKEFVDFCLLNKVNSVVIGDVEGVQRNTSKKNKKAKIKKKIRRKQINQKLSNLSFGKINQQLQYKLEAKGIKFSKIDESFTTQTCPVCGLKKKTSTRNYNCRCGYKKHRDIHSACNILSKFLYGNFKEISTNHTTYLRIN